MEDKNTDHKLTPNNSLSNEWPLNSNSQMKQVYMCSCGKQYQSFPATYLHFRTKHNIKLSTKPTEKRRVVALEGETKKITYLVNLNSQQHNFDNQSKQSSHSKIENPALCQQLKFVNQCISKYIKSSRHCSKPLYQKLMQFLGQLKNKEAHVHQPVAIDMIPFFLNDFTLSYLPTCSDSVKIGSQQWKETCVELTRFCNWLRKQKYTDLILIYQRQ